MKQSYTNTVVHNVHSFDSNLSSEASLREGLSQRWKKRNSRHLDIRQANPQTSLTLDPKVISTVVSTNGGRPGLKQSLESPNNFINYCETIALPITNGQQRDSCNPAPIGVVPSVDRIPSVKFQFPTNGVILRQDQSFTLRLAVNNLATGYSVNGQTNYLAAPLQLDANGLIIGRTAVAIEKLDSLDQTTPTNPVNFALYKGFTAPAVNGVQSFDVTGLQEGYYRISSITTGANDQPIMASVLQHGAIDDSVYCKPELNHTQSLVATGFASNGQDRPVEGQVPSLTSTNSFINFCLTVSKPLTNGQQSGAGSCNPIPIGVILPQSVMPSLKFASPKHGAILPPNKPFSIKLNYANLVLGMTDTQTRYLSAPQQLDTSTGRIRGYVGVVIEALTSINQTSLTNPQKVALASGMIDVDEKSGALITNVTKGLPAGFYRMSSIAVTENHYPVAVSRLQRGTVNDAVYFTVGDGGGGSTAANTISASGGPTTTPKSSPTPAPEIKGVNPAVLGGAIGGALGGVVLIGLLAFLLVLRRRRKRNAVTLDTRLLNPSDYDYEHPHIRPYSIISASIPPLVPGKDVVLLPPNETPLGRRLSTVSAAPSYHTVAPLR